MTTTRTLRAGLARLGFASVFLLAGANATYAQLRIVSYNTSTGHNSGGGAGIKTARPGTEIVLQSIGEELVNGIARPIDVLLLQEQFSMSQSTQSFVNILNGIYGTVDDPTPYARGVINGLTSEPNGNAGRPGIVYNRNTVQLVMGDDPDEVSEIGFGTVNGTNQARSTLRYRIQPVGYDESAIFYAYNSHYKAGSTATDQTRRNVEATNIRNHATYGSNALGEGAHALYVGDFNMQSSSEAAFQTLLAAGPGQAQDPINRLGNWNNNASFADIHTQAPCNSGCAADQTTGGVDDRFDFQLMTSEFLDGEGLSYITGSYHTFGNNGSTFNNDINAAGNTYVFNSIGPMTYTKPQILTALKTVTDHLPVVADYQLPAILEAIAGSVPATLNVGELFNLDVSVGNAAPVQFANGADELDYSLTTSGDVSGEYLNQVDAALNAVNIHSVLLDTSTPGLKSGIITISSTSQSVQNGLVNIPINYEVIAPIFAGDYNDDGVVDAADYVVWQKSIGTTSGLPNDPDVGTEVDEDQYNTWVANFGNAEAGSGGEVPEPGAALLLVAAACIATLSRGTLTACNRQQ